MIPGCTEGLLMAQPTSNYGVIEGAQNKYESNGLLQWIKPSLKFTRDGRMISSQQNESEKIITACYYTWAVI